jgi:hypothetical protein
MSFADNLRDIALKKRQALALTPDEITTMRATIIQEIKNYATDRANEGHNWTCYSLRGNQVKIYDESWFKREMDLLGLKFKVTKPYHDYYNINIRW